METNRVYGSFGRRLLAWLFDELSLWLVPLLIMFVTVATVSDTHAFWLGLLWFGWELVLLQWILALLYRMLTMYYWQGSLGKILGGLKIDKEDGSRITWTDTLLRFPIGYTVSGILWSLGFFWILKDPKRRGFHDQIAGTVVVEEGSMLPLIFSLVFLILVISFLVYATIQVGENRSVWTMVIRDLATFTSNVQTLFKTN